MHPFETLLWKAIDVSLVHVTLYSLPSINVTLGSGSKLTFIEVLTIKIYKITFLSNIQILTFINISNCEESL